MRRSFGRTRPSLADVEGTPMGRADTVGAAEQDRDGRSSRSRRRRGVRLGAALVTVGLLATACDVPNFWYPDGVTNHTPRLLNMWKGSVIAALAVGVFVWGLIFYAVIAFRKRSNTLPRQVRYNLPVEILYTVVPVVIVAGLFYYTARDQVEVTKLSDDPDVTVNVVGFRWNWQFRYLDTGVGDGQNETPIEVTGRPGEPPVLVLPQGRSVRFVLTSPDVIHSFWVPEFLFKRDVIPGRINEFELTPTETGTFIGRCAELCGTDHDRMIFYVEVVPADEYDRFIQERQTAVVAAASSGSTTGSAQ